MAGSIGWGRDRFSDEQKPEPESLKQHPVQWTGILKIVCCDYRHFFPFYIHCFRKLN